jgi:hypothetical protein
LREWRSTPVSDEEARLIEMIRDTEHWAGEMTRGVCRMFGIAEGLISATQAIPHDDAVS